MTTINPDPKLLRYLWRIRLEREWNDEERAIVDLLPPMFQRSTKSSKEKPRNIPELRPAAFRMPADAYVSPHDATSVRCDTGKQEIADDRGNRAPLRELVRYRPANNIVGWIKSQFGGN